MKKVISRRSNRNPNPAPRFTFHGPAQLRHRGQSQLIAVSRNFKPCHPPLNNPCIGRAPVFPFSSSRQFPAIRVCFGFRASDFGFPPTLRVLTGHLTGRASESPVFTEVLTGLRLQTPERPTGHVSRFTFHFSRPAPPWTLDFGLWTLDPARKGLSNTVKHSQT
jgi:hypothetical protein